jgi:hypothetical protein
MNQRTLVVIEIEIVQKFNVTWIYHYDFCRKEDLRIGSEEVWRKGGGIYSGCKRFEPQGLSGLLELFNEQCQFLIFN